MTKKSLYRNINCIVEFLMLQKGNTKQFNGKKWIAFKLELQYRQLIKQMKWERWYVIGR